MKPILRLTLVFVAILFCSLNSHANTFYWTGLSSSNWNTLGNWALSSCGGTTPTSLPGTGDSVVFSGGCSNTNCSINTSINVLSFRIDNAYTGTISQGSGNSVTVAYGKFADGTFTGSSAAITFSTSLTIEDGIFTTTSGTTNVEGNFSYTGGTFNHNNGRVVFYRTLTVSGSSSLTLYDAEFQAVAGNTTITLSSNITVDDSTLLTGSSQLFINSSNSSVINAEGEVKDYNTSGTGGGTATIKVDGSSTQHITGNATTEDVGKLPNLTINSTGGTVYLIGYITMGGSTTLTYSGGTINAGTSTVVFYYDNTITGDMTFNNVVFQGTSSVCVVTNTITANGNMSVTSTGLIYINTGTINLYGNFYINNNSGSANSSVVINFSGTGNDSIISQSGNTYGSYYLPAVTINKTGGTLYLIGIISLYYNWTNNYSTANINPGSATFYFNTPFSLNFGGTYSTPIWNAEFSGHEPTYNMGIDSALIVRNNLTLLGSYNFLINGNSINVYGNIIASNTGSGDDGGTTVFNLLGSQNDSIISPSGYTLGECYLPSITINKTGGTLYLIGNISESESWTNNYSTTNINPGSSTLYFYTNSSSVTIGGTYPTPVWNAEFSGHEPTYSIGIDSALIVKNNLTLGGTSHFYINSNSINIYGNIIASSTGSGDLGGTVFNLVGSANDSIISPSGYIGGECNLPSLTINKSGGTLYLIGTISEYGNWTNNYSQTNINYETSILFFDNNCTIGGTYRTPLWNAEFYGNQEWAYTISNDSALVIDNNLTIAGTEDISINGHCLSIHGNIIASNTGGGDGGTTAFNLVGSAYDSIISPSGYSVEECRLPAITINKNAGTLYLIGNITENNNWTNNYSQTNINAGTSTLYFDNSCTIGGTYRTPLWNTEFYALGEFTYTISNDSALIVKNNLTLAGAEHFFVDGHCLPIYGNILADNTSAGDYNGTTVFNLVGSQNDSIISPSGYTIGECDLPSIYINKTGGTLYLIGNVSGSGNWTYIQGTINPTTSTVGFRGTGTIITSQTSSNMSFYNLQVFVSGSGNVLGSILNVANNLTLNSGTSLNTSSSNYQINIGGDWINDGSYSGNNSNVNFNGSGSNYIEGSSNTTFYSLTLDQTGTLTLSDPVTVTNSLNLTNGDILSSSTDLITLNNGSSVSGASNASFVNGPVKKIGNSSFTFPTGAGSSYHAIGITAPSSSSDAFEAQYFNTLQTEGSATDDSLTYVSTCDYWTLSQPAGSSSSIDVSLFWGTNSCNIARLSSLRVGYWNGSEWKNLGQSTSTGTTSSGSVKAATASSLSSSNTYFAISKHSPTPTANPSSNTTICYGSNTTISSSPTGGFSPYTYSWSPATSLSNSTASNPTATPTSTTTYTVTVEDGDNAPTATGTVVVTVNPVPSLTITPSSICYKVSSLLTASGASTYTWSPSTGLSATTGSSITATLTTPITYTITGTGSDGCTSSVTDTISVNTNCLLTINGNGTHRSNVICNCVPGNQ